MLFAVLYRCPSQNHVGFENSANTFEYMVSLLAAENLYGMIMTGDFNSRPSHWCENDIANHEG